MERIAGIGGNARRRGFTLVELLIVVVVIAILAAITIVAYNGITTRAENTKTIHAVGDFVKAYGLYAIDNGAYPPFTGCLGNTYPGTNNWCLAQSGTAACFGLGGATTNASLNSALSRYMGGAIPQPSMQQAPCGGTTYIGAYASYSSADGSVMVVMILRGNQACPSMSPNVASSSRTYATDTTDCSYHLKIT